MFFHDGDPMARHIVFAAYANVRGHGVWVTLRSHDAEPLPAAMRAEASAELAKAAATALEIASNGDVRLALGSQLTRAMQQRYAALSQQVTVRVGDPEP